MQRPSLDEQRFLTKSRMLESLFKIVTKPFICKMYANFLLKYKKNVTFCWKVNMVFLAYMERMRLNNTKNLYTNFNEKTSIFELNCL